MSTTPGPKLVVQRSYIVILARELVKVRTHHRDAFAELARTLAVAIRVRERELCLAI